MDFVLDASNRENRGLSRRTLLAGLLGILPTAAIALPDNSAAPDAHRLDDYMNAWVKAEQFSGTILVASEGRPVLNKGYGYANVELGVKNSPDTVYQIASLTKAFTAAAIMLLQERGKLSIAKPIRNYLPDCPEAWNAITVRHLLTHTSGIPNYTHLPNFLESAALSQTDEQIVNRFRDKPLEFTPGSQFHYCNSGYHLLGMIVAKVPDADFTDFMSKNIFAPLGMKHTVVGTNKAILPKRAAGYIVDNGMLVNTAFADLSQLHAEGGICSTTGDLLLWDQALYSEKLLSRATLDEIFTPYLDTYGYGWNITALFGRKEIRHSGLNFGFASHIKRFPDDRLTVIVLSNNQSIDAEKIATGLAAIMFKEPYNRPRAAKTTSPNILKRYVGEYQMSPEMTVKVTLEDGRLFGQGTGTGKTELFAFAENRFFLKNSGSEIMFVRDKRGEFTTMILEKDNRKTIAKRLDARQTP